MRYLKALLFSSLLFSISSWAATGVFPDSVFKNLDYGLYWFGANNQYEKATSSGNSAYYRQDRPVMIYVHGWQNGSSKKKSRETFFDSGSGRPDIDFADFWIAKGYNVGVLYWNQFADESEVKDAEAKIWTAQGNRDMRWRDSNGSYSNGPNESATELLASSYITAMNGYSNGYVRLAGHSLGNQMVINLTKTLSDRAQSGQVNQRLVPDRVALLDPFYSKGDKSYLGGQTVAEVTNSYVSTLKSRGILFEAYRTSSASSSIFVGDANKPLLNQTAFTEQKPWYFNFFQQTEKHISAAWLYFWSIDHNAPIVFGSSRTGLSAAASDSTVEYWMNSNNRLVQKDGVYSKDPIDDTYNTNNRL